MQTQQEEDCLQASKRTFSRNPVNGMHWAIYEKEGIPWQSSGYNVGDASSIPGQGAKIPYAARHGQKFKKKEINMDFCAQEN